MDGFATYIIDAAWVFFVGWSVVLLALSAITFGPELSRVAKEKASAQHDS